KRVWLCKPCSAATNSMRRRGWNCSVISPRTSVRWWNFPPQQPKASPTNNTSATSWTFFSSRNGRYLFSAMVGMARCAVPARVVAGGTNIRATLAFEGVAPLHAARTSQRDVPTTLNRCTGCRYSRKAALNKYADVVGGGGGGAEP